MQASECAFNFVFIGSIIFISYKGLHFSIEFTGGTVIEVSYENEAPIEQIRSKLKQVGFDDFRFNGLVPQKMF